MKVVVCGPSTGIAGLVAEQLSTGGGSREVILAEETQELEGQVRAACRGADPSRLETPLPGHHVDPYRHNPYPRHILSRLSVLSHHSAQIFDASSFSRAYPSRPVVFLPPNFFRRTMPVIGSRFCFSSGGGGGGLRRRV